MAAIQSCSRHVAATVCYRSTPASWRTGTHRTLRSRAMDCRAHLLFVWLQGWSCLNPQPSRQHARRSRPSRHTRRRSRRCRKPLLPLVWTTLRQNGTRLCAIIKCSLLGQRNFCFAGTAITSLWVTMVLEAGAASTTAALAAVLEAGVAATTTALAAVPAAEVATTAALAAVPEAGAAATTTALATVPQAEVATTAALAVVPEAEVVTTAVLAVVPEAEVVTTAALAATPEAGAAMTPIPTVLMVGRAALKLSSETPRRAPWCSTKRSGATLTMRWQATFRLGSSTPR